LKIEKNVVLSFLSCTVSEIGPIAGFCAHDHVPILPQFGGVPVGSDRPIGVSVSRYKGIGVVSYFRSIPTCVKNIRYVNVRHRQISVSRWQPRQTDELLWQPRSRSIVR